MAFVFNFPDVGEGIEEGRIVEWLVAEGEKIAVDQPLVKVETDKAVVELPSPRAGTVLQLHHEAGAEIHVGEPLVTIGEAGEAPAPGVGETGAENAASVQAEAPGEDLPRTTPDDVPVPVPESVPAAAAHAPVAPRRPMATPRTRALARQLGVDLAAVRGTGSSGRITDDDVRRAAAAAAAPAGPEPPALSSTERVPAASSAGATRPPAGERGEERVPLTHLRKVIARSMAESKRTAAHVTHVDEADVTDLVALHAAMRAESATGGGARVTLLPLFVKALVAALKEYPAFNAQVDEEAGEMIFKRHFDIGVAVDTPEGLIVPVVRDAGRKSVMDLAAEIADLAGRARERKLSLDELRGATCTITNIGPLGGVFATPIIPLPQLAIVGLHTIKDRPAVYRGEIAIRKMMYLSVSFDHRWIDGAQAARFMTDLVRLVESPGLLMARM